MRTNALKSTVYDALRSAEVGKNKLGSGARVGFLAQVKATPEVCRYSCSDVTSLSFAISYEVDEHLIAIRDLLGSDDEYDTYIHLRNVYQNGPGTTSMTREEQDKAREEYRELWKVMFDNLSNLSDEEKVALMDNSLFRLKTQVEKRFGKRLPTFTPTGKNWVNWAKEEKEKADNVKV